MKDLASLNKMEMLPWDAWGSQPRPNNNMQDNKKLKFFDALVPLSEFPDVHFKEIQEIYTSPTAKLQVPDRVFNAMHGHLESIA